MSHSDSLPSNASSDTTAPETPATTRRSAAIWLAGAFLVAAVASLAAAHAPSAAKKLLLFAMGYGVVVGGFTGWWGRDCHVQGRGRIVAVALLLTLAGQFHIAWLSYRQMQQQAARNADENPQALLALKATEGMEHEDDTLRRLRREYQPQFADYLSQRVSSLGEWPNPWPATFWIAELVLAAAAGAFCAGKMFGGR